MKLVDDDGREVAIVPSGACMWLTANGVRRWVESVAHSQGVEVPEDVRRALTAFARVSTQTVIDLETKQSDSTSEPAHGWLTVMQAAQELEVTPQRVGQLVKRRGLHGVRRDGHVWVDPRSVEMRKATR